MIKLTLPLSHDAIVNLEAGDQVLLSGTIYTARDAAHKRLIGLLNEGKELPFDLVDQIIYYVGPTPNKPGEIFGSGGPTTSGRMDAYAPTLLDLGLKGMIGKGLRQQSVIDSIQKNEALYFGAIGGAGAYIKSCITSCEIIAFEDLGPEAIRKLEVKDFPLTVVIDSKGNDLYKLGKEKYLRGRTNG